MSHNVWANNNKLYIHYNFIALIIINVMILADEASEGTQTLQYKCVRKNYARLTEHLRTNHQAKERLFDEFVAESWYEPGDCPNANALINIALDRIKQDLKEYEVFISMLERIPSTNIIVKDLKGIF